jgi:hypothetical protein
LGFFLLGYRALATQPGWVLEQTSDIAGNQSFVWSKAAMRINSPKEGLVALAKAPDWKVQIYSPTTHKYCEYTTEQFKHNFTDKQRTKLGSAFIKGNRTQIIAGLNTSQFELVIASKNGAIDWHDHSQVWLTKGINNMPRTVETLVLDLAGIPLNKGVPLRILRIRNNGQVTKTIDTIAYRKVTLADNYFNLPPGMKRVDNEISLLLEDDSEGFLASETDYLTKESNRHNRSSKTENHGK